jgi:hypothetical protein
MHIACELSQEQVEEILMDDPAIASSLDRENDWPRSILVLLGSLLIVLAFLFLGWVREQSPAATLFDRISNFSQPGLINNPGTFIERQQDSNLNGATVLLQSVRVKSVPGDYVFMIEVGGGATMPVVLLGELSGRQPETRIRVQPGQLAYIFGFLLPLHDPSLITNFEFIDELEQARLRTYSRYINAIYVSIL